MWIAHAASIYMLPAHTCKLHRCKPTVQHNHELCLHTFMNRFGDVCIHVWRWYDSTISRDQDIHIEIQQHLLVRRLVLYHYTVDQNTDHDVMGHQWNNNWNFQIFMYKDIVAYHRLRYSLIQTSVDECMKRCIYEAIPPNLFVCLFVYYKQTTKQKANKHTEQTNTISLKHYFHNGFFILFVSINQTTLQQ
jgi:hypothetical protein